MRPITRETIMDRRQPVMRWSAVFAGAAVAAALWVLLQTLGMGVGLFAIDVDDQGSLRDLGVGTTIVTLVVPFIAMFVGGIIAGRLAGTVERRIGAIHGLVVWALTSFAGIVATVLLVGMLANTAARSGVVGELAEQAQQQTQQVDVNTTADATAKVLLGAGLSSLIALVMGVLGGAAGVRTNGRRRVRHDTVQTVTVPPPPAPPVVTTQDTVVATPPAP